VSRPSSAGYRCLADQHLPGPVCDRLVHLLDAALLNCQQEQRRAVRSAEHGGENRAVVLNTFQHLATLADPHDSALVCAGVACLDPDGTDRASMQMPSGPRPSVHSHRWDRLPESSISKVMSRPVKDSEMINVLLSGVITMPLGNTRSPATWRVEPSGVTSAMMPDVGGWPARKPKRMLLR
jgi:hypothetical protein